MSVQRLDPVTVIEHHFTSITIGHLSGPHDAVGGCPHRNAVRSRDIDSLVELSLAVAQNRILALAETACNRTHDRPERRRVSSRIKIAHSRKTAQRVHGVIAWPVQT